VQKFALDRQDSHCIFWFSAESPETIQAAVKEVDAKISSQGSRTSSLRQPFKDWLAKEHVPWLLIFDNAHEGFDVTGLCPRGKGKIIITSRHRIRGPSADLVSMKVGPLSPADAGFLFKQTWERQRRSAPLSQAPAIPSNSALSFLQGRPLAIVLAASHLALTCQNWTSTVSQLSALVEETVPDSADVDPLIWKWVWLVLEDLGPSESQFLALLAILDSTCIPMELLDSMNYRPLLPRVTKLGLVRSGADHIKQFLYIPLAIRDCLHRFLELQSNEFHNAILQQATDTLDTIVWVSDTETAADASHRQKTLETVLPHIREVCLRAKSFGLSLEDAMADRLQVLSAHALGQASSHLIERSHRQFWRAWLVSNGFDFPDTMAVDEDESEFIELSTLPPWISAEPDPSSESGQHLRSLVLESLCTFYQDDLVKCLLMGAIGHCWHGIREDVFELVRQFPNAPQDSTRLEQMNDAIEKGATRGLMTGAKSVVQSEKMRQHFLVVGKHHLNQIVSIIATSLEDCCDEGDFDDELLKSAISTSLEPYAFRAFPVMGQGFVGLFRGTITGPLCSVLESSFPRGSAPSLDSLETSAAFIVGECSTGLLEERSRKLAKAYWEIIEAMTVTVDGTAAERNDRAQS
jgi:hypothetical protein